MLITLKVFKKPKNKDEDLLTNCRIILRNMKYPHDLSLSRLYTTPTSNNGLK